MLHRFAYILLFFITTSTADAQSPITIKFVDSLEGDFSFANKWSYPEGVYVNQFGQLSCDGMCPPETDAMKNTNGKIYKDSLSAFYKLVDTTHRYYTIESEADFSEWAGTNFATAYIGNELVIETEPNAATHCVLKLVFNADLVNSVVTLTSITNKQIVYNCIGGNFRLEKTAGRKDFLKASFDLQFADGDKMRYWRGRIQTAINEQ